MLTPEHSRAHQLIGSSVQVLIELARVQVAWNMAELDSDLCCAGLQGLACLEQERHTIPPRIVDEHGHRTEGRTPAAMQSN